MYDRDLLILAAKGADIELPEFWTWGMSNRSARGYWDPLMDDAQAFRLAVKLNIPVFPYDDETSTGTMGVVAKNWGSKLENTRRAIVMAAAEIGKSK